MLFNSEKRWPNFHSFPNIGYTFNVLVVGTKQICQWLHLWEKDWRLSYRLSAIRGARIVVGWARLKWWSISAMLMTWIEKNPLDINMRKIFTIIFIVFATKSYAFHDGQSLICSYSERVEYRDLNNLQAYELSDEGIDTQMIVFKRFSRRVIDFRRF